MLPLLGACTSLEDVSAAHTGCNSSEITILESHTGWSSRNWVAECRGRRYQCAAVATGTNSGQINCTPEQVETPVHAQAPSAIAPSAAPPRATGDRPAARVERVRQRGTDGTLMWVVRADFESGGRRFRIAAAPSVDATRALFTISTPERSLAEDCPAGLMVDGDLTRLELRASRVVDNSRRYEFVVSVDLVRTIATASRVAGRICDEEWRLGPSEQQLVRELVLRIDEELAWSGDATSEVDTCPDGACAQDDTAPPAAP